MSASSNYALLTVHAARRANGDLCLLVVNKDPCEQPDGAVHPEQFRSPTRAGATTFQYGKPEDLNNGDLSTGTLSGVGGSFSVTVPSYSMTVLDLVRPATPYATWQGNHFTAAQLLDATVSGDLADPTGMASSTCWSTRSTSIR